MTENTGAALEALVTELRADAAELLEVGSIISSGFAHEKTILADRLEAALAGQQATVIDPRTCKHEQVTQRVDGPLQCDNCGWLGWGNEPDRIWGAPYMTRHQPATESERTKWFREHPEALLYEPATLRCHVASKPCDPIKGTNYCFTHGVMDGKFPDAAAEPVCMCSHPKSKHWEENAHEGCDGERYGLCTCIHFEPAQPAVDEPVSAPWADHPECDHLLPEWHNEEGCLLCSCTTKPAAEPVCEKCDHVHDIRKDGRWFCKCACSRIRPEPAQPTVDEESPVCGYLIQGKPCGNPLEYYLHKLGSTWHHEFQPDDEVTQ